MLALHAKGHIQFQDAQGRKNRRNCQGSDLARVRDTANLSILLLILPNRYARL